MAERVRTHPLPLPPPEIPAVTAWHTRHDRDSAHRWLRGLVRDTLAEISGADTNRRTHDDHRR
ncbi:MAG TPA: hypothetical protein VG756_12935 [Pseudonocardiaceae bacterium]|nr:hypothetical protein [Pseudonocardiaceae bacterium]